MKLLTQAIIDQLIKECGMTKKEAFYFFFPSCGMDKVVESAQLKAQARGWNDWSDNGKFWNNIGITLAEINAVIEIEGI